MYDPTPSKVMETIRPEPPIGTPTPMGLHGVDDARDQHGEDDVTVVVRALGDGAGDDGGAGGSEGSL